MKISKISIDRPVTTAMFILIAICIGIVSLTKLPVDLYPDMNIPYAIVITNYNGAGPNEIETLVTDPLEQALATVRNIKEVQSISSNGVSTVILEFVDNTNMDFATLDVREKVDLIKDYLPDGVDNPIIMKIDLNAEAMMQIGIGGDYNLVELNDIIENKIQSKLERIEGVASVELKGAKEKEIKITLLPKKMNGYKIDIDTISSVLRAQNINLPIGEVNKGSKKMIVRSVGEFKDIKEIRNLPIATKNGIIYLRDIAKVEESYKDMKTLAYMNNEPCIVLSIKKQSTANTVKISKQIHNEINKIKQENPDLKLKMLIDQSDIINQSIN